MCHIFIICSHDDQGFIQDFLFGGGGGGMDGARSALENFAGHTHFN